MDILFIGGVYNKREILNKSKGSIQNAANALQWNIIRGLDECNGRPINILNSIFIGSYPRQFKDMLINSYSWSHVEGANDKNVGFINIGGIKHLSRANRMANEIEQWASNNKDSKFIVAYSVHMPFLYAIKKAKDINPNIKACLIVPDLPQYMNLSNNPGKVYTFLKSIDYRLIKSMLKYIDSYVLLTNYMADKLGISKDKYIVMEGMVNIDDLQVKEKLQKNSSDLKILLYTGTLNWKYGIGTLLEAFQLIEDENFKLQICGAGEAAEEIIKLSKVDPRVEFFGSINREKALDLQKRATVLINPRSSEGEFTKYSFPSKNLEYLLSGRPTIAYRLPGIPDEYEKYIYFIDEPTSIGMARRIMEVCKKDSEELNLFGKKAQSFVLKEKNNVKQAKRIIELIKS